MRTPVKMAMALLSTLLFANYLHAQATDLLLTEIVVTPTAGEFVEIYNPSASTVDLSNFYLTDATYSGGGTYYYNIVTGTNAGGGGFGDFLARFPDGASINPGEYQTVSMSGSTNFFTTYGVLPTYELFEDDGSPDAIPDMREGVSGSINGQGGLTDSGEVVILFGWDGTSDLVGDSDYAVWGDKVEAVDKTSVSIDGPDGDSVTSDYLPDTSISSQDVISASGHASGNSFTRIDLSEGAETQTSGNSVDGHDETSEDLSNTWGEESPTPNAAYVPPAVQLLLTEIAVTPTAGEFIEIYNPSASAVDLSDFYLTDATYSGGGTYYYNIVTGTNAGGGGFGDFLARFPNGASINPGEYQTVSLSGSTNFFTTYGVMPTYELFEDDGSPDAIPDMREGVTGSINGQGGLTDSGEVVILFKWDGASDLVGDSDYAVWGDKVEAVDKTSVSIDGPDGDSVASTYLADTLITGQDVISAGAHAGGNTFTRIDLTEGTEAQTLGNGLNGHDETSEDLSNTWGEETPTPNAAYVPSTPTANSLLLTEIAVTPTEGEFVEIYNPSTSAIDLSDFYLTDATYSGGGTYYYNIVTGTNAGGGGFGDFLARFPNGASINPGEYQTVSLSGSTNFFTTYGVLPTYELFEDDGSPDAIPDMREGVTGSINGQGGLTDSGEVVILFKWDGASDLVGDSDYAVWGDKVEAVDKTSVSIDGPDGDSVSSTYLADTSISSQDVISTGSHSGGTSFTRLDLMEGAETQTNGNGLDGHDETSEDLSNTWGEKTPTPNAAYVPTAEPLLLSEIVVTPTAGEFVEIFNPGASSVNLSNFYLTDATSGSTFYYNIVTGSNAGGGSSSDFHARFPDGASIGPGEFQTVAMTGSDDFFTEYGQTPTYELFEDGASADAIPDMREAFSGSINNQGGLSNAGEVVILYFWDGLSDLVTDVDYAVWGDKVEAVDKTGISIDGPDGDTTASTYLNDTAIASQDVVATGAHLSGESFNRIDFLEGTETQTGGNGVGGNDETSENLSVTWKNLPPSPNGLFATGWIINEFQADPDSANGDANGDGTVDTSQDEFVEIYNQTGSDVDISGWTLSDAVSVRHTFPPGTTVADKCAIVVFGGGSPTGIQGDCIIQTASTGMLGLNNGGDSIIFNNGIFDVATVIYGSEGGNNQSLTLDPDITGSTFVQHSVATGSGGALFSPGTMIDGTSFLGCAPLILEVYEIQGSGSATPYNGLTVTANGNIVTGVTLDGFTMQTPDSRDDLDSQTSNAIYVYTDSAPTVAIGDEVNVKGTVSEYYDFTEIGNTPEVSVISSGNPMPTAIPFSTAMPSGDPTNLSCLECMESMLVQIPQGIITAGNQRFASDPYAEAYFVVGTNRTFREPGIEYPGEPGLPVWDGNPEILELDLDRILTGRAGEMLAGGQTFSATGVLAYEFGNFELWPTDFSLTSKRVDQNASLVRDPLEGEITVGSQNLYRLFTSDSNYQDRLNKFSLLIRNEMKSPDIIAFQEVGGIQVLQDLAAKLHLDDPTLNYAAYLIPGNDIGGIEVGFLVKDTIQVDNVTQLMADMLFTYDGTLLHDRPPLLLEVSTLSGPEPMSFMVMVIHNRSMNNIDDPTDGNRVRLKRNEQAVSIANYIQTLQGENLLVVGDFNAFEFTDGYVDVLGQITGNLDPLGAMIPGTDLVNPDLTNLVLTIPSTDRYSYSYQGSAQVLDHALVNDSMLNFVTEMEFCRVNSDFAENLQYDPTVPNYSSDHDGLVVYLRDSSVLAVPTLSGWSLLWLAIGLLVSSIYLKRRF